MIDQKINLLLVDDEQPLLDSIKRRLDIRNFNVIIADRGEKALDIARTNSIDVAVVDLKMPGLSGKEVILSLKESYPWLEIIILTGHGSFDPEKEDFFQRAFSCLAKPCELETLLNISIDAYKKTIINKYNLSEEQIDEFFRFHEIKKTEEIKKLKEIEYNLKEKIEKFGLNDSINRST